MRTSIISLGLAAIIGGVIGMLLQSPAETTTVTALNNDALQQNNKNPLLFTEDTSNEINSLRQQLKQETIARIKLQNNVDILSKKFAKLELQKQSITKTSEAATSSNAPVGTIENRDWFNEQALIDAGINPATAKDLKSRYEKQELEKLYLRDQAMREGWFGSRRHREELEKMDTQLGNLQEELGDESYSAYLFATGQSNRVTVQSVLAKSSADIAGVRTNDQILRYGGQRIYNWRDLRDATTQGDINATVTVEIIREGEPMQVYIQRGPLGIRMSSVSAAP